MVIKRCKLSRKLQGQLPQFFVAGVTARTAAELVGVSRPTAILYYKKIRQVLCYHLELDESYFTHTYLFLFLMNALHLRLAWCGGHRKGKRGRGAAGKVIVFGILKRGGKVYAKVIENTKASTLMPIITRKILLDSVVYTDCYRSYNTLDVEGFSHHRINHSTHFAEEKTNHINGIENFYS